MGILRAGPTGNGQHGGPESGPLQVVARYRDGRVVKGYSLDFAPGDPRFHLVPNAARSGKRRVAVTIEDLKAVFFVRDFTGNPDYSEQKTFPEAVPLDSRKAEVVFADGEVLAGYAVGYHPDRPGFFLFPADPNSNNLRVFVVTSAVREVRAASGSTGAQTPETTEGVMGPGDTTDRDGLAGQLTRQCKDIVDAVQTLARENEQLRAEAAHRDRNHAELLEHARMEVREESAALAQQLVALETAHQAVLDERDRLTHALGDLSERYEALLRQRQWLAGELNGLLGHLAPAREGQGLGSPQDAQQAHFALR